MYIYHLLLGNYQRPQQSCGEQELSVELCLRELSGEGERVVPALAELWRCLDAPGSHQWTHFSWVKSSHASVVLLMLSPLHQ